MQKIADVKDVLTKTGGERYGGEAISQLQHALQCASLAEAAHASPALISAALLHDIGHLVDRHSEGAAAAGIDRLHEKIGAGYLEKAFGPAVSIPVLLHVAAKRYLCAVDSRYFDGLSAASVQSLAVQGGPFNAAEAAAFIAQSFAEDAVNLRRWDDLAKDPAVDTAGLDHFLPYLQAAAASHLH